MSEGNEQVVLCERGIRTYETSTRNTLDISAVPVLKGKTHFAGYCRPQPRHRRPGLCGTFVQSRGCSGRRRTDDRGSSLPSCALSDGPQSLTFKQFAQLMADLKALRPAGKPQPLSLREDTAYE